MSAFLLPEIPKSHFIEELSDVFILKNSRATLDRPLYKYIDIAALLDIIDNHNFIVKRRGAFTDRHESGTLDNPYNERLLIAGKKEIPLDKERWQNMEYLRNQSANIPTACFTLESCELVAMWKSFTSGYTGVRFSTTLRHIIESLDLSNYTVFAGEIEYPKTDFGLNRGIVKYLFSKNVSYYPEKEFRIYLIPKTEEPEKYPDINKPLILRVNGEKLVQDLCLSPFLPQSIKGCWLKQIRQAFPCISDRINHSKILERT